METVQAGKPNITLGALGQAGHGKTTLMQAIVKVLAFTGQARFYDFENEQSEAAPERNYAGISGVSFIEYQSLEQQYTHLDFASRTAFLRSVFSGKIQMNGAILVVDANEGLAVQAKEQIRLIRYSGLSGLVVFLNKCDLLEDFELAQVVEAEIREFLAKNSFQPENVPFIYGSALRVVNSPAQSASAPEYWCISDLIEALDKIIPADTPLFNRPIPASQTTHTRFEAEFYMLPRDEVKRQMPLLTGVRPDFAFGETDIEGHIVLPEAKMVMPGDLARIRVKLVEPVALEVGLAFAVKEKGRTIGHGIITSLLD